MEFAYEIAIGFAKQTVWGQQSRQQALRDYCPNIYTVFKGDSLMSEKTWDEMHSEPTTAETMKLHGESYFKKNYYLKHTVVCISVWMKSLSKF